MIRRVIDPDVRRGFCSKLPEVVECVTGENRGHKLKLDVPCESEEIDFRGKGRSYVKTVFIENQVTYPPESPGERFMTVDIEYQIAYPHEMVSTLKPSEPTLTTQAISDFLDLLPSFLPLLYKRLR